MSPRAPRPGRRKRACKHRVATSVYRRTAEARLDVERRRCWDCGAHLPLGPAKDDGEHAAQVALEIRAAEIADQAGEHGDDFDDAFVQFWEGVGWWVHVMGDDPLVGYGAHLDDEGQTGFLARCIATTVEGAA